jgi:hypothetical protein
MQVMLQPAWDVVFPSQSLLTRPALSTGEAQVAAIHEISEVGTSPWVADVAQTNDLDKPM